MEPLSTLLLSCSGMFAGCYLAGSIPLAFSLSESHVRSMSVFGSGLLIGTALAVIIPEGIHIIFTHSPTAPSHTKSHDVESLLVGAVEPEGHHHGGHDHEGVGAAIGVSLIAGFMFMLLLDHCSHGSHSHGTSSDAENQNSGSRSRSSKFTTTLGLLVHGAADGIAMAAVVSTKKSDLELLVFLAIMLHKFPASFGLVSYLLNEKTERYSIRRHLLAFSASAPLGAITTYIILSLPIFSASGATVAPADSVNSVSDVSIAGSGITMLFSAGTFLYVATVHVLPNIQLSSPNGHLSNRHVIVLIIGAFFPTLLAFFHHH